MTGQVNILVLLLVVLALYLDRQGQWAALGGAALGTAILFKVTPLFLIPYFALRKRWAVLKGLAIALAIEVGVSLLVIPNQWEHFGAYWLTLRSHEGVSGLFPITATSNMSPASVWALFFGPGHPLALASINITLYSEVFFLRSLPPLAWRLGLFAMLGLYVIGIVVRPTTLSQEMAES